DVYKAEWLGGEIEHIDLTKNSVLRKGLQHVVLKAISKNVEILFAQLISANAHGAGTKCYEFSRFASSSDLFIIMKLYKENSRLRILEAW
ncbi:10565_t:CDS:2, partial [Dentiscutata heterogama]